MELSSLYVREIPFEVEEARRSNRGEPEKKRGETSWKKPGHKDGIERRRVVLKHLRPR